MGTQKRRRACRPSGRILKRVSYGRHIFPLRRVGGCARGEAISTSPRMLAARIATGMPVVPSPLAAVCRTRATPVATNTFAIAGATAVVPPGISPATVTALAVSTMVTAIIAAATAVAGTVVRCLERQMVGVLRGGRLKARSNVDTRERRRASLGSSMATVSSQAK